MRATSSSCRCGRSFRGSWRRHDSAAASRGLSVAFRAAPTAAVPRASRRHGGARRRDRADAATRRRAHELAGHGDRAARIGMDGRPPAPTDRRGRRHPGVARPRGGLVLRPARREAARLCDTVPYVSTTASRSAGNGATSRIRWPAAGSSSRGGTTPPASRRAPGCRRNGSTAPRRITCCCARSSAALTIPARSTSTTGPDRHGGPRPRAAPRHFRGADADARLPRRNAGAQHIVGHRARIAALAGGSPPLPGLFVAGSGFESIGIPDCVANGRRIGGAAADYVRMGS